MKSIFFSWTMMLLLLTGSAYGQYSGLSIEKMGKTVLLATKKGLVRLLNKQIPTKQ